MTLSDMTAILCLESRSISQPIQSNPIDGRHMIDSETIVRCARGWLGTPYHHQASVKGVGCDCLGLIRGLWRELCGPEPEKMPP